MQHNSAPEAIVTFYPYLKQDLIFALDSFLKKKQSFLSFSLVTKYNPYNM